MKQHYITGSIDCYYSFPFSLTLFPMVFGGFCGSQEQKITCFLFVLTSSLLSISLGFLCFLPLPLQSAKVSLGCTMEEDLFFHLAALETLLCLLDVLQQIPYLCGGTTLMVEGQYYRL